MSTRYDEVFRALVDEISDIKRFVRCPVSDLAGPEHYFQRGTGVLIGWDVMGDDRQTVTVCPDCAEVIDQ